MANTKQRLGEAFELIKQQREEDATHILKPITEEEPDNADAWWLLANASSEPRDARRALVNVLRIKPDYPKARLSLDKLNEMYPPRDDELMMMMDLEDAAPPPLEQSSTEASRFSLDDELSEGEAVSSASSFENEFDSLFDESEDEVAIPAVEVGGEEDFGLPLNVNPFEHLLEEGARPRQAARAKGNRRLLRLVALLLFVCLGAAVLFMALSGGDSADEDDVADLPTQEVEIIADVSTLPAPTLAVEEPEAFMPIEDQAVDAGHVSELTQLREAVQQEASLLAGGNQTVALYTSHPTGGFALMVQMCTTPGPNLPPLARDTMQLVARKTATSPAQTSLAGLGVAIQDCGMPSDTLYRALTSVSAAVDFANNPAPTTEALAEFQTAWTVHH